MLKCTFKIAVLSLSALAFVSCKKDDKSGTAGDVMTFTASIGGGAKTEIDGFDMKWSGGETILINGTEFTGEKEGDGTTAVFTGETVDSPYKAYFLAEYPESGDNYVLPAIQTYDGKNLSKVNPMYAESSTTDLQFHNICAMLELKVKGQGTVKEIVVTATDNQLLSGAFKVTKGEDGKYFAELIPENSGSKPMWWNGLGSSNTVTLNCGEGVELKAEKDTTFYIALPQGNYTDLKLELKNGSSVVDTLFSMNFKAGQIRTKELTGVSIPTPTPPAPSYLPGEFSVSGSTKVKFSRGNLYYDADDNACHWKFEANQWDFRTYGGNGSCINGAYNPISGTPSGDWGLFGWSTGALSNNWGMHTQTSTTSGYADGDFKDWGGITDLPDNAGGDTWRTLSKDEWDCLLNTRDNAASLCARVTLKITETVSVPGLVILPDDSSATPSSVTTAAALESSGAVFLPASGSRYGTEVNNVGSSGFYWLSTPDEGYEDCAYYVNFNPGYVYTDIDDRYSGYSVRLVR